MTLDRQAVRHPEVNSVNGKSSSAGLTPVLGSGLGFLLENDSVRINPSYLTIKSFALTGLGFRVKQEFVLHNGNFFDDNELFRIGYTCNTQYA